MFDGSQSFSVWAKNQTYACTLRLIGWQPTILACIRIEIVILIVFSITGYCNVRSQLRFHLKTSFFTGNKAKPEIGMLDNKLYFGDTYV